jgi:hypothetical protein
MSTLRLKLAAIALISALGASAAHAQSYPSLFAKQGKPATVRVEPVHAAPIRTAPSRVVVDQQGRDNGAAVGQTGLRNNAGIYQRGESNFGQTSQTGASNTGSIYQVGRNNSGTITQTGDNNAACIIQLGRNNSANVTQTGGQSVGVVQSPRGTWEIPAAYCGVQGRDPESLRRAALAMR